MVLEDGKQSFREQQFNSAEGTKNENLRLYASISPLYVLR